jgi:tRNA threonylcarbamoyl adenosine modification protein YeaZ
MTNKPDSLWLDTTSNQLMLGLSAGESMVWQWTTPCANQRQHSALVLPALQQALAGLGAQTTDLRRIGCNQGPGSFTGIRTGLSMVRAMGQWASLLGLPLQILVFNQFMLLSDPSLVTPQSISISTQRQHAYCATLQWTDTGFVYLEAPAFRPLVLNDTLEVAGTPSADSTSPQVMLQLASRYPNAFTVDWPELLPLYLQNANVTLPKGTLV